MKRATVTIPEELEKALEAYRRDAEIPPGISAVMQAALQEYLTERGYLAPEEAVRKKLRKASGERPWPRYPLYSGDPTLAERDEEALAGGPDHQTFGDR